jgi:predicted phage baseplate assembly protein
VEDGAALQDWGWLPRLIDAASSDRAFAVEPFRMRTIGRNSDGSTSHEYDGRDGDTIRFGDGTFGAAPAEGTVFTVSYRTGEGARGNVAPDAITTLAPGAPLAILGVTNPFAAEGGADAEADERVRRLAPHAFRATQFRAVRSEDYVAAAETLPWVSKAGSVFRWSGSWTSVFTTVDPRAAEAVGVSRRIELLELLNRYRLAGYDSYTPQPRFVSVDLTVTVCARSHAFRGDVEEGLREALSVRRFFHPDAFTFGTPLERSALEAAVQSVNGVGGVLSIRYRRRGTTGGFLPLPPTLRAAKDEILRVDNDPSRPERGAIRIVVEGGK